MKSDYKTVPAEYSEFLLELNAHDVTFFERNIRGHLEGVYRVLDSWNADSDLAVAGLFHAVYLTDFFVSNEPTDKNRERIRAVIGPKAEALAYLYCVLDRTEFVNHGYKHQITDNHSGSLIALSKEEDRKLVELIWANSIEQLLTAGEDFSAHQSLARMFEASRHRVGSSAIAGYASLC